MDAIGGPLFELFLHFPFLPIQIVGGPLKYGFRTMLLTIVHNDDCVGPQLVKQTLVIEYFPPCFVASVLIVPGIIDASTSAR